MTNISKTKEVYIGRINNVINFIENNLDQNLSLESLSKIACFSPFHFHRIFTAITNETLNAFINRKRIEKTASILLENSEISITALALKYGFNDGTSYSRAFKKFYGISPSKFKEYSPDKFSKICKVISKNGKEIVTFESYVCNINNHRNFIKMNAQIEVKELPELKLAYITHVGDCSLIGQTYDKLIKWARPKGLINLKGFEMVTVYHDNPKITDQSKFKQSACILLNEEIKTDGEVGLMSISKGKFVIGKFEIDITEFEKSWNGMFLWLTENGYKTRDGEYFEIHYNDYREHPKQKFILDICIPAE